MSVENQKVVVIHKPAYDKKFLQIGIDEMRMAQQQMTYCEFVLYLYLAGNADGFKLELSQKAFENATGYKKSAYHAAVSKLIDLGYIRKVQGYTYEFRTTPFRHNELRFGEFPSGIGRPPRKTEQFSAPQSQFRQTNREIDKKDNLDKINKSLGEGIEPIRIKKPKPKEKKPLWDFDDVM